VETEPASEGLGCALVFAWLGWLWFGPIELAQSIIQLRSTPIDSANDLTSFSFSAALTLGGVLFANHRRVKWLDALLWVILKPILFLFFAFLAIEVAFRTLGSLRLSSLVLFASHAKAVIAPASKALGTIALICLVILGLLAFGGYTIDALSSIRERVKIAKKVLEPLATAALVLSSVALTGPGYVGAVNDVRIARQQEDAREEEVARETLPVTPPPLGVLEDPYAATLEAEIANTYLVRLTPSARERLRTYSDEYRDIWKRGTDGSWTFPWKAATVTPIDSLGQMLHERFESFFRAHQQNAKNWAKQFQVRKLHPDDEGSRFERELVAEMLSRVVNNYDDLNLGNALASNAAESVIDDQSKALVNAAVDFAFDRVTRQRAAPQDVLKGEPPKEISDVAAVVNVMVKKDLLVPYTFTQAQAQVEEQRQEKLEDDERLHEEEPHLEIR
jgi:hypothetical protein